MDHRFMRRERLSDSGDREMRKNKPPMRGGVTRSEFEGLREDLQKIISEHPRAKLTILLLDENGWRTDELSKARRYGFTVYEDDRLVYEEMGRVAGGMMIKE